MFAYMAAWSSAEIALAEGDPQSALIHLRQIGAKGNPWGYNNIRYRELLAKAHHMAGQYADAEIVLEELLRVYPGHALARFQLADNYEKRGRADEAETAYVAFLDAWAQADAGLPQLKIARERLEVLRSGQP